MFKILTALPVLALIACSDVPAPKETSSTQVALYNSEPDRMALGQLSYRGGLHIEHPDDRFGGWSALEVSTDGTQILSVSDSAYWMTASLGWDEGGFIAYVDEIEIAPILGTEGQILEGNEADSETIALMADGRYAVSFERHHRINAYDLGADLSGISHAVGEALPVPPGADDLPNNGGLEGLTPLGDGGYLAAIEYPQDAASPRLFWRYDGANWSEVHIAPTPDYGLTSLTRHGGYVYALERFWNETDGTRIRIIRFDESQIYGGALIEPEFLGALEAENPVDNFEGISVIDHGGETLVLIISDDNYNAFGAQRTLLLAFAVD